MYLKKEFISEDDLDNLVVGDYLVEEPSGVLMQLIFIDRPIALDTWGKAKVIKGNKFNKKGSIYNIDDGWYGIRHATPEELVKLKKR